MDNERKKKASGQMLRAFFIWHDLMGWIWYDERIFILTTMHRKGGIMDQALFKQLAFVREVTLQLVKDVSEQEADVVPDGFNNNIRWNLGHIYLVQEVFAFARAGEIPKIPDGFVEWFNMGTKPADWEQAPPSLEELSGLLREQIKRIEETFMNRLQERSAQPMAIRTLNLETVEEFLTFSLYHEGTHTQVIKSIKRLIQQS